MNIGTRVDLDKIIAEIGDKKDKYRVKNFTLNLQLNAPAAASVILAQGMNKKKDYKFNSPSEFEKPFTPISVLLYMEGENEPIVLFRGFIANISKTAGRNPNGSYVGTALACISPPSVLQGARMQGYRFWATKLDGKGQSILDNTQAEAAVDVLLRLEMAAYGGSKDMPVTRFNENVGSYITQAVGYFVEIISRNLYSREAVTVHKMNRGVDIKPGSVLFNSQAKPEIELVKQLKGLIRSSDAFTVLRSLVSGPLYLTMVPTTSGKFDLVPEFPWDANPLTHLTRSDYMQLDTTANFMGDVALVDAVFVPVGFASGVAEGYEVYPERVTSGISGISKVATLPPWMSPYLGYIDPDATTPPTPAPPTGKEFTRTDKVGAKKKATEIAKIQKDAATLAEQLAKMAFNRVKSSGSTLQVEVPWYRLEFLEALGYLIQIERPNENAADDSDLYGYLNAASLSISSTTGGSSARLKLGFSHVHAEEAHTNAFDKHPFWDVTDTFRTNFAAVVGSGIMYNRDAQVSLQGDTYDDYLAEVKGLMQKDEQDEQ